MTKLSNISDLLTDSLTAFEMEYASQLQSSVSLINEINSYLNQRKGKQLRPVLTLLSAGACMGKIMPNKVHMAVAMELLHNSSLIHDDVVDESSFRRGLLSINSRWSNKIAVLCGDYYFSKVLRLLCTYASNKEMSIINRVAVDMSEGELLQQQTSRLLDLSVETYFNTIYKKTASLLSACCELGAYNSADNTDAQVALCEFGRHFGLAFQLRDDLLDYTPKADSGKPYGNDIKEKKMTMPLICYMNITSKDNKKAIFELLEYDVIDDIAALQVVRNVEKSGALEQTQKYIEQEAQKAVAQLATIPDSKYKDGLIQLTQMFFSPAVKDVQ